MIQIGVDFGGSGGLSNVSELLTALPATIGSYVFSNSWATKLVVARWGDSSGVRGAARSRPGQ
jgi:fructokinase